MQSDVQYAMQPPTPYAFSCDPYVCFNVDDNDKNDSDVDVDDDRKEEG